MPEVPLYCKVPAKGYLGPCCVKIQYVQEADDMTIYSSMETKKPDFHNFLFKWIGNPKKLLINMNDPHIPSKQCKFKCNYIYFNLNSLKGAKIQINVKFAEVKLKRPKKEKAHLIVQ
jgi:hypothetical protein